MIHIDPHSAPSLPVRSRLFSVVSILTVLGCSPWGFASSAYADDPADFTRVAPRSAEEVAAILDVFAEGHLEAMGAEAAPIVNDETFLRRVSLDLTGAPPTPEEITLFVLDPSDDKRPKLVESLLASEEYSANWARYWRDVIFSRATDQRTRRYQPVFEKWLEEQLAENKSWNSIVTEMLTATGDVSEDGSTALIMVHSGDPAEIAAEASRIFLGIQIQCANCHDHPTDQWKRADFHQLAAYFTRVRFRAVRDEDKRTFVVDSYQAGRRRGSPRDLINNAERLVRMFDRDRDGGISKTEVADSPFSRVYDRLVQTVDANKDGMLTAAEIKRLPAMPLRPGQGSDEYYMPDLSDPSSRGTQVDPVFFVNAEAAPPALNDLERRTLLAETMTAPDNPWFARAFVNRMWSELPGAGFYMPIDDMGPERVAFAGDMLDVLAAQFVAHDYDIKWLLRTIALTKTYQRTTSDQSEAMFASSSPTRLRADALFESLQNALGAPSNPSLPGGRRGRGMMANNMRGPLGYFRSPRFQFTQLFEFDPSTPQADVMGTIPQALFMMNSPLIENAIQNQRGGQLTRILRQFDQDDDVTRELYLTVLSRQPTESELKLARDYLQEVDNRREAFEDLYWALLNSSEFLMNR
jgi:hypothetical protein